MKKYLPTILGSLLSISALVIIGMRLFFPYHRVIALLLYGASWVVLFVRFHLWRKGRSQYRRRMYFFMKEYKFTTLAILLLIFSAVLLVILFPMDDITLLKAEEASISARVESDLFLLSKYIEGSERVVDSIVSNKELFSSDYASLSSADKELVLELWLAYYDYFVELEKLKEYHSHFYQINYFYYPSLNLRSFLIAYTSFVTNYESGLIISDIVGPDVEIILNEASENSYYYLKQGLTDPRNIVRLNAGWAHLQLFGNNMPVSVALDKYNSINKLLQKNPEVFVDNPLDFFEQNAFRSWYPLQKGVAVTMGNVRTASRDYFVTFEQVQLIRELLEPGDILLERRNWHLSNVGLPGFWPHAAIYVGNLSEYFGDEFDTLVASEYPEVHAALSSGEVIEAVGEGVIIQTLEESAHADYVAALRPQLGKNDKKKALLNAFSHYGKPYDYNFDFVTDNAIVCSELVYKAYSPFLDMELEMTAGRLVLPASNFVKMFDDGRNFDFVFFLDGSEALQSATFKSPSVFASSWKRVKWDVLVE